MATGYVRLGEMLVREGLLTRDELERVITAKRKSNARLGELVVALGLAEESAVASCLAHQYGMPLADLDNISIQQEAIDVMPGFHAVSRLVLPVSIDDQEFHCVISDPLDIGLTDELSVLFKRRVVASVAAPSALHNKIVRVYGLSLNERDSARKSKPAKNSGDDRAELLFAIDQLHDFIDRTGFAA